jgi:DNA invertase Pin-like site-specific DNA recombinase
LTKAIAHAKRIGGMLVIAKLDWLARNVAFVSALMESGVPFVACDNPHATRLTVHILAAIGEEEARAISTRTREALAAYKVRGGQLGTPENLTHEAQRKGADANRVKALQADAKVLPLVRALRSEGKGIKAVANALNEAGYTTESGHPWSPMRVKRALQRAGIYTDAETPMAGAAR